MVSFSQAERATKYFINVDSWAVKSSSWFFWVGHPCSKLSYFSKLIFLIISFHSFSFYWFKKNISMILMGRFNSLWKKITKKLNTEDKQWKKYLFSVRYLFNLNRKQSIFNQKHSTFRKNYLIPSWKYLNFDKKMNFLSKIFKSRSITP